MRRIAFVLGKPPRGSSVVPEVIERLRRDGCDVTVHLPHEASEPVPPWLFDADLVVQRGLNREALVAVGRLEETGVRCCNRVEATMAAHDRLLLAHRLAAAGLPVPTTVPAATWADVLDARGRAVVVKARDGWRGRGAAVLVAPDGALPSAAPFAGPYVVQDFVAGADTKLYVAGHGVRGRQGPPTPQLADLARRAGAALGLEIYGVDVVGGCMVDVNPFPGFRGVPQAARLVTHHINRRATSA